ncbi:cytochrome c-550 PedF [Piscinibacter gummiphilus]|uniref:cytochrome c-550 PedF n=1 Tax=Piscinibacter gummiphilus TaxID=946333 RepID=UPI000A270780|nr:cytochrome c-550 PedF [Piscinibacter gummiphilus]ATU65779.1 cytochrome c-550 PedF [Piscinibacter gummiphilus]GLS93650.1 cytochrome c-550 PedF [Piscinibacter gummiphilus]
MKPFPYAAPYPSHRRTRVRTTACVIACTVALFAAFGAFAHGDTVPQAVDTSSLPRLGDAWRAENPYRTNDAAVKVGSSAYNQNCARCHGLEAVSGGIAPDLRKLDNDCATAQANTRATCVKENDEYFLTTVRHGRSRNGAVYMPPFEGTFDQEAIWAIKAYLETRREKPF